MVNIVLTLGGLNKGRIDRMDTALRGFSTANGRTRRTVQYPQEGSARSIREGVKTLDKMIREETSAGNHVTVFGMSQGAEVASEWLEQNARRSDAPPAHLLDFVLVGNPCRRLGGVVTAGNFITKHGYLGRRKPTPETQYTVTDVATPGDVWANADGWPTGKKPKMSLWDILLGRDPHTDEYDDVDVEKCRVRGVSGNTSYLVA